MDEMKYAEKVGEVLEWLKVNDAGALGPVIQATCEAGLTATTDEDRDKFWASIRSLCGTLPKSPIRRGIQSTLMLLPQTCLQRSSVLSRRLLPKSVGMDFSTITCLQEWFLLLHRKPQQKRRFPPKID